ITYNGTLYAVIEGEFNISAAPSIIEEAMKANGVLLFNGKWYIFPRNDTEAQKAINALHEIFVEHRIPSEDPTSTSPTTPTTSSQSQPPSSSSSTAYETPGTSESQEGSGICGPAFVLLLVTVPVILFKKRR
ncbi:MAG: CGP-CTERM sorting domain-containing protein, partial [Thermococcus sp.]|nr:CGP-CTERM sorting domain-containing protein [Thermococcus sp.]